MDGLQVLVDPLDEKIQNFVQHMAGICAKMATAIGATSVVIKMRKVHKLLSQSADKMHFT